MMSEIGWPLRIVILVGVVLIAQQFWSISTVRYEPLPVSSDLPKFSDVNPDFDRSKTYRGSVRAAFERLKDNCTQDTLREFAHAATWFYINAVGSAGRAGVSGIENAPGWSQDNENIDNYIAAMAEAGVLRSEHLPANAGRAEGRIPIDNDFGAERIYPDWAEPPLTLGCPRG